MNDLLTVIKELNCVNLYSHKIRTSPMKTDQGSGYQQKGKILKAIL